MATSREDDRGLTALVSRLADGIAKLVSQHLTLARLELAEDAKTVGREAGKVAAFVPFVLLGYALLCVALAFVIARWVGVAGGFAIVGAANLIGGGLGAYGAVRRLSTRKMLGGTVAEFSRSRDALSTVSSEVRTPTEIRSMEKFDAR